MDSPKFLRPTHTCPFGRPIKKYNRIPNAESPLEVRTFEEKSMQNQSQNTTNSIYSFHSSLSSPSLSSNPSITPLCLKTRFSPADGLLFASSSVSGPSSSSFSFRSRIFFRLIAVLCITRLRQISNSSGRAWRGVNAFPSFSFSSSWLCSCRRSKSP
uniref:(northern house mosquito) hypothetical protein n=1 Tax=Culex pipiens TaxID=7175 RepID=A0A8D8CPX7_CULPI